MIWLLGATCAAFAMMLTLALRMLVRVAFGVRPDRASARLLGLSAILTLILSVIYVIALRAQM